MVGSSASIAGPNTTLNTIVAEILSRIATRIEKAKDIDAEVQTIVTEIVKKHKRVIFNGNNYTDEWVKEAKKRGLQISLQQLPLFRYLLAKIYKGA